MLAASSAFAGDKACCAKGASQCAFDGMRQFGLIESHSRSKDEDRNVAGRMHEGRLHKAKPRIIPDPRERNSFRRAVRAVQSTVQKYGCFEEERLI